MIAFGRLAPSLILGALSLAAIPGSPRAFGAETSDGVGFLAEEPSRLADMPARERELVDLLLDARRRYEAATPGEERQQARLAMQIRFARFMTERQDAENWMGVVRMGKTNREGDRWIGIEIAPRITLMTGENRVVDPDLVTLIEPHSSIYATVGNLTIGQPVVFSGRLLADRFSTDDDMVEDPKIFARFTDVRAAR